MSEFTCKVCSKILKSKRTLNAHEKRHDQDGKEGQTSSKTASTSVDNREYFHCTMCKKKYLTKKGLHTHQATVHSKKDAMESGVGNLVEIVDPISPTQTVSAAGTEKDLNEECGEVPDEDEIFNVNNYAVEKEPSYFFEDDEAEEALRNMHIEGEPSKPSNPPKKNKTAWIKCNYCVHKFQSIASYVKHRETHVLSDLYKKAPSVQIIQAKSTEIVPQVLDEIGKLKFTVGFATEVTNAAKALQEKLMTEEWTNVIERIVIGLTCFFESCDSYLTPSDLRAAFLISSTKFCVNLEERKIIIEMLRKLLNISQEALNILLGIFLRLFSTHLLTYFIHFMLHDGGDVSYIPLSARFHVSTQKTDTLDFKQTLHYIAGSNVKSVLRTGLKIKKPNCEWSRVIETIKKCFIVGEGGTSPDEILMEWTLDQDRGGLIKISGGLLDFYVELGVTVDVLEHMDGSLYQNEVLTAVTNSGKLIRLWDEAVKGSLPDDESFKLLHALCGHFCCTWRRGIISRRLDELAAKGGTVGGNKHGKSGVAFRAQL